MKLWNLTSKKYWEKNEEGKSEESEYVLNFYEELKGKRELNTLNMYKSLQRRIPSV
jgi:hypothetical protein